MALTPPPPLDERGLPPPRLTFERRDERPFWIFLLVATAVFAVGVILGTYFRPHELPVRTDLEFIEGIEDEPPPLGEPDAGAAALEEPTPPEPDPVTPEPDPPVPMPEPLPDFTEREKKPPATPAPLPKLKPKPVVAPTPRGGGSGENPDPNAKQGTRGVTTGVPGGKGGQKGGFVSRPDMPIDNMIITRKYYGRGTANVTCAAGTIVRVTITSSTGFSYCDNRAKQWIQDHWKCAPGTTGSFSVPIIVKPN